MTQSRLATFWHGRLSPLEIACLQSFVQHGHGVTLYTFDAQPEIEGVTWRSASKLVDQSIMSTFMTNGLPNIAHFADYFRLVLLKETGATWIDSDMFCLAAGKAPWFEDTIILTNQDKKHLNAVLRLSGDRLIDAAISEVKSLANRDVPWSATMAVFTKALLSVNYAGPIMDSRIFVPIEDGDWDKLFLPEHFDACVELCTKARGVHLYNNILQRVGYLKSALPPQGSYLRYLLDHENLSKLFCGEYNADTVRQLTASWKLRFDGNAIGIGAAVRQLIPGLKRTVRRRWYC